jgi:hypothetical protein
VIELFPVYRKGEVLVARCQCRQTLRTFSLLPHQLAPYPRYTVDSMVLALMVAAGLFQEQGRPGLDKTLEELAADCDVTLWLVHCWVQTLAQGLRGAHAVLCGWHELWAVRSGTGLADTLSEVAQYLGALGARGPPRIEGIEEVLLRYGSRTGRFLIGKASQERRTRLAARAAPGAPSGRAPRGPPCRARNPRPIGPDPLLASLTAAATAGAAPISGRGGSEHWLTSGFHGLTVVASTAQRCR